MATGPQPVQRAKHIFMGLHGDSGIGKTRMLGTLPNTLIIRPPTEHTDSIRNPENVQEIVVEGHYDMDEAMNYLRVEGHKHSFVWLDSASLFQDSGLDEIWNELISKKPHRAEFGLDKPEYGKNMDRLARWVRAAVSLDKFNFGFTGHSFKYEVPTTGEVILMPWIQGKQMAEKFCGYMTLVGYYELVKQKEDEVRVLRTNKTTKWFAKDQYDAFPDGKMVNPTMPKIIAAVEKARKANGGGTAQKSTTTTAKKKVVRRGSRSNG